MKKKGERIGNREVQKEEVPDKPKMPDVIYDWEVPRLNIEAFITDYVCWRLGKADLIWHEAPELPDGVQPEFLEMRKMASIFEERSREEFDQFLSDLIAEESVTFARFCEIVDEFARTPNDSSLSMSYGRMTGIFALTGCVCVDLMQKNRRRDVAQIVLYTAKFIEKRIRASWKENNRSWANFMEIAADVDERLAKKKSKKAVTIREPESGDAPLAPDTVSSTPTRRLSMICTAAAVSAIGAFVVYKAVSRRSVGF